MRKAIEAAKRVVDVFGSPFVLVAGSILWIVRRVGLRRMPVSRGILRWIGVMPVRDHYYEPLIRPERHLRYPLSRERTIVGLEFNMRFQRELLASFSIQSEHGALFATDALYGPSYFSGNGAFEGGDAEWLYAMVRRCKPRRIVEIGSGFSTRVSLAARARNRADDASHTCEIICIEPYEQPWLDQADVTVVRKRVEDCDPAIFDALEADDILFIDSSHVLRPQGDVVFELFEVLGRLRPGVWIHVHDVFTPRDYLKTTVFDDNLLWNEQYAVEAFLCFNSEFEVAGMVNHLWHNEREAMLLAFPWLASWPSLEPGSLWFRRVPRAREET